MKTALIEERALKRTVKAAVEEVLKEQKDMMADLLEDAMLDVGFAQAIREGEHSPAVSRRAIFNIIKDRA